MRGRGIRRFTASKSQRMTRSWNATSQRGRRLEQKAAELGAALRAARREITDSIRI